MSGVNNCTSKKKDLKSTKSYTIKDNANNAGICKVTVSSKTQYRKKTCSEYKECATSGCGCKTWNDYSSWTDTKKRVMIQINVQFKLEQFIINK